MKNRAVSTFLALALCVTALCACGRPAAGSQSESQTLTWQEQYDLGVRYLSEGNYEEAILAFTAAIEIDPKRAEAYLYMAYAYIGQNDFESARNILQQGYAQTNDVSLKDKLEEIDHGSITDYEGRIRMTRVFDSTGMLSWYYVQEYDGAHKTRITVYDKDGTQTDYWDGFQYDSRGNCIVSCILSDTGSVYFYCKSEFNDAGQCTLELHYTLDDSFAGSTEFTYNKSGKCNRITWRDKDDMVYSYGEYEYDVNGHQTKFSVYDADGVLENYQTYIYDKDEKIIESKTFDSSGKLVSSEVYD